MDSFAYPEFIARFYDIIYHQVRDGVDNDFFLRQTTAAKGKILELGAGTGRLFTEALNQGADIYGIDISSSMTDILKSKLPDTEHHRIITDNAVTMKWDMKFDLIIAPFRMFSHILDVKDQLSLLNNICFHLTDKGKFIFDVFVPDPNLLINGINSLADFNGEYEPGKKLKRIINSKADIVNQLLNVSMKLIWDEGNIVREEEWEFQMRFFYRYELEHLIRLSSLKIKTIFGDYMQNPLSSGSKEFIMICTK